MGEAVVNRQFRIAHNFRPVHGLQQKMLKVERLEALWGRVQLRINEF